MKKYSVIMIVVILVAALAGGVYVFHRNAAKTPLEAVPQKQNAPNQTPKQAAQNNRPAQDVPVAQGLSVTDVRAAEENNSVSATAHVTGGGSTSGTCVFTFENSISRPVVRQVSPTQSGSDIVCSSGNIAAVEFSAIGTWKLTVNYYAGATQATAGTANVDIN